MSLRPPARTLGVAAAGALAVAVLGGLATDIGPWYAALKRPPWQPPDTWFGPVWTLIYALCTWSAATAWHALAQGGPRRRLLAAWALNAGLNLGWSLLFFRLRRPDWALLEVGLLWGSVLLLLLLSRRARPAAGWMLLPYLGWVSFAAALNLAVVRLNAPFGGP
jgi:tryptophan-rich sensory protein